MSCSYCKNTGACPWCNGTGEDDEDFPCSNCSDGYCPACEGSPDDEED